MGPTCAQTVTMFLSYIRFTLVYNTNINKIYFVWPCDESFNGMPFLINNTWFIRTLSAQITCRLLSVVLLFFWGFLFYIFIFLFSTKFRDRHFRLALYILVTRISYSWFFIVIFLHFIVQYDKFTAVRIVHWRMPVHHPSGLPVPPVDPFAQLCTLACLSLTLLVGWRWHAIRLVTVFI